MRERSGLNNKSLSRIAYKAFEDGLKHSELRGSLKRWADGLYLSHCNANQMRLFGDKMYLFKNNVLITIVQVPHKYIKIVTKLQKQKV